MPSFRIETNNQQTVFSFDTELVSRVLGDVLAGEGYDTSEISVAVVNDLQIREINRHYLGHDYATDVLSFVYAVSKQHVEGELILSAETAARVADQLGWSRHNELSLYLVHGALHLIGYDDRTAEERQRMRQRENHHLSRLGIDINLPPRQGDRPMAGQASFPAKEDYS